MGPAAILSILVNANATQATATLSKFDKQIAATNAVARKGIDARLGGTFNQTAFKAYDERLARAARVARDRTAFKAQLGASFNNSAFLSYEKGVDKASKSTEVARAHTERLSGSFSHLARTALEAGGAFLAFEKAKSAIESTVELGHATERLSAITGMDIKSSSSWIEIMKVRGVATRATSMAFITLSRNIRSANEHGKTATKAFKELGVSQGLLKKGDPGKVIKGVADGMEKLKSSAERTAIAQQLFGRGAQGLIPILTEGSRGVDEALAAAQRYGAFLPNNVALLKGSIDAQHNMNLAMDGFKISFTEGVLPALVKGSKVFLDFIAQMRSGKGAGGEFAKAIKSAFDTVKTVVTAVTHAVGGLGNAVKIMVAAFVVSKITAFIAAINPITVLFAAVAAAAFLIIKNWSTVGPFLANVWNGIRSVAGPVIAWLSQAWTDASTKISQVARDVFPTVKQVILVAFDAIKVAVALLKVAFDAAWNVIGPLVGGVIAAIKFDVTNILIPAFNLIKGPLGSLASLFGSVFGTIKDIVGKVVDTVLGLFSSLLHAAGDVFGVLSKIPFLGGAFKGLGGDVKHAADEIDNLRRQLAGVPDHKTVKVNLLLAGSNVAASLLSQLAGPVSKLSKTAPKGLKHAMGGIVTQPGYFAGEEGSAHPEVILASNPAYRRRNVGLWQQAGKMLGIAGFAQGGIQGQITADRIRLAQLAPGPSAERTALRVELIKLAAELRAATKEQAAGRREATARQRAAERAQKAVNAVIQKAQGYKNGMQIPSLMAGNQIQMQQFSNALQAAQNAGNVPGQQKALKGQLGLENLILRQDQARLAQINRVLAKHLSRGQRAKLQEGQLALLQEIGNIIGQVGSAQSSLTTLSGSGSAAGSGTLDLNLAAGITLPTAYGVRRGVKEAQHGGSVTQHITNNTYITDLRAANRVAVTLQRSGQGTGRAVQRALGIR